MAARRVFWAGLLPLLLLAVSLDLHPADEGHEPLLGGQQGLYYPEAAHPHQPLHLEHASPAQRPHCPFCLHRLQTAGAHLALQTGLALPVPTGLLPLSSPQAAAFNAGHSTGARAPPFA